MAKSSRFAEGALVLCQCAVGNAMIARTALHNMTHTKLQQQGFDSVRAQPGCQESGGCAFDEMALYSTDQLLPTHIVHFKLVKSGAGTLVAQQLSTTNRVEAHQHSLQDLLKDLLCDADEP